MTRPCHENSDDSNDDAYNHDMTFSQRGCCFWIPCYDSKRPSAGGSIWWEPIDSKATAEPWWTRGWKKARELSELIAGPKWKTFIRKFRKTRSWAPVICIGCLGGDGGESRQKNFHYDPMSYALNFDDGQWQNGLYMNDDLVTRNFSSRFAAVPACPKCSANIGNDAPLIT